MVVFFEFFPFVAHLLRYMHPLFFVSILVSGFKFQLLQTTLMNLLGLNGRLLSSIQTAHLSHL